VVNDCGIALNGECGKKGNCSYKIGLVIGRRFGNACERNRAKRRMRAMCDAIAPDFAGDWCMAIRILDDYRDADFREVRDALRDTFLRAGLIRNSQ
jgi:ribonuclease P protein component